MKNLDKSFNFVSPKNWETWLSLVFVTRRSLCRCMCCSNTAVVTRCRLRLDIASYCNDYVWIIFQTKKIGDLVCCHASRYEAPVAADFVMVPAPKADKKTFFKGTEPTHVFLYYSMTSVSRTENVVTYSTEAHQICYYFWLVRVS